MANNRYITEPVKETRKVAKKKKPNKMAKSFRDVLNGNVLAKDYVVANLPYFFFLTALMLFYIGLGYNTDKNVKKIEKIEAELIELNSEYISLKTELNLISGETQIKDSVKNFGLSEMRDEAPKVITVSKTLKEKIY